MANRSAYDPCPKCGTPKATTARVCWRCYTSAYNRSPQDKLHAGVDQRGPDECWPWTKNTNIGGYGIFYAREYRNRTAFAHRVAWETANGKTIPPGLFICHHCDNPPCCNPKHLFLGTAADNVADMFKKGRGPHGRGLPFALNNHRGENNPRAKLTDKQVAQLQRSRDKGADIRTLSKRYGISVAWCYELTAKTANRKRP